jgi:hypothetical protein
MDMIGADVHQRFSPDAFIGTLDETFKKINPRWPCSHRPQSAYNICFETMPLKISSKRALLKSVPLIPP